MNKGLKREIIVILRLVCLCGCVIQPWISLFGSANGQQANFRRTVAKALSVVSFSFILTPGLVTATLVTSFIPILSESRWPRVSESATRVYVCLVVLIALSLYHVAQCCEAISFPPAKQ